MLTGLILGSIGLWYPLGLLGSYIGARALNEPFSLFHYLTALFGPLNILCAYFGTKGRASW